MLMLKDMIWGHFLAQLHCWVSADKSLDGIVLKIWTWGFRGLRRYGDNAYNLIKMIEPICTARLIQMSEDYLDPDVQLHSMRDKYAQKEISFNTELGVIVPEGKTLAFQLTRMLSEVKHPDTIAEVFSLSKILGHPYVDPVLGSEALRKLAHAPSSATFHGIKAVGWSFCHMFTKGFIDDKKRWPPLKFNLPPGRESVLQQMCEQQHMPLPLGLSVYDPSDWDFVTFLPVDEFDYGEDILSLMTDKSLSYKRSEIDNSWNGRLSYTPKKPTSSNRVLHQLLSRDLNMREICEAFSSGVLPYDWYVVTIHPKEREAKTPEARSFAIMTIEPRSFFCLLETNIAHKIFPFIPEQTMTMSHQKEEELFLDITKPRPLCATLSIGIDLAKWCSHFRKRTTMMVGDRLNQLLGVKNLYGSVHDFFRNSLIVLRHPAFTPKQDTKGKKGHLKEEPGIYTNAEAGLEGIQQKFWTLITLCMLHWAVWRYGLPYKITCQGDNLVIHITIHFSLEEDTFQRQQKVRDINTKVLRSISEAAEMIGHDVNPDECFSSTGMTSYGKNLWYKGNKLRTILKVMTRMFPKTTSDTPSSEAIISNIAATGTSMVERTSDPLECFLVTKAVEYLVIHRELNSSMVHDTRLKELNEQYIWRDSLSGGRFLCCLVPSNLGGFPVSSLAEFMYRGHSDPLSSSLGSLAMFRPIPIINKFLNCLLLPTFVSLDAPPYDLNDERSVLSREKLVRDPYSIPLQKSGGAMMATQEAVQDTIRSITRNKQLKPIIRLSTDRKEESKLMALLLSVRPLDPKISHEIHKASLFGVVSALSRRFTDTRTLRRLSTDADNDLVLSHINNDYHYVKQTLSFLFKTILVKGELPTCNLFHQLIQMRGKWGMGQLEGVTNYHPLMAGKIILTSWISPTSLTEVINDQENPLLIAVSLTDGSTVCKSTRGPIQPYLGNETSEKAISKWVKPIDSSPPLRDALRLIQIAKICTGEGSHLRRLLEVLAATRTNLPLTLLYEMSKEQIGGTTAHRLNTSFARQGSRICTLPNWSTHFTISSNLSRELGKNDYPVSFAEFYLTLLSLSYVFYRDTETPPPFGVIMVVDLDPLQPVQDITLVMPSQPIPKQPVVPRDSYYLFSQSVTLSERSRLGCQLPTDTLNHQEGTTEDALSQLLLQVLTSGIKVIRKGGYRRAVASNRIVVDLPEAALLSLDEYMVSSGYALLLYSSRHALARLTKREEWRDVLLSVVMKNALLLAPQVHRTVSLSTGNTDHLLRHSPGRTISERGIIRLAILMTQEAMRLITQPRIQPPTIFEQTTVSFSSSLANRIYLVLLVETITNATSTLSCKFLGRVVGKMLDRSQEINRVVGLVSILTKLGWNKVISTSEYSAEKLIRLVRERVAPTSTVWRPYSYALPHHTERLNTSTDLSLALDSPGEMMEGKDLLECWDERGFPGRSDAHLRWAPVSGYLQPGKTIYIVGIGAGGLLRCIPGSCKVFGVDLPATVEGLGQSFTTYTSSEGHPDYSTRPLTWLTDLGLDTANTQKLLKEDIQQSNADIVIIDVDRVDPISRLRLRHYIAQLGVQCWVRVYSSKESIQEVMKSVDSLRGVGDTWWIPYGSAGLEIIVGSGPRPLGLMRAHGRVPPIRTPRLKIQPPQVEELTEFVLAFGGSIVQVGRMDDAIFSLRHPIHSITPFNLYTQTRQDIRGSIDYYGRVLCRMANFVVPFYL